jgi:ATP synthase protein I
MADSDKQIPTVAAKINRKRLARGGKRPSVYFGLGMFGLVGWSVAIPTVLAIALGIYLDRHWPRSFSWTLMLLVIGVGLGCWNAWVWIQREAPTVDDDGHSGD